MVHSRWEEWSDEELAAHCAQQLEGCLDELVRRYERRIAGCAQQMTLSQQDAEDAVQEILLRLVSSVSDFRGEAAFSTWLYRLAHNTCVDQFRKRIREQRHRLLVPPDADPAELLARIEPAGRGEVSPSDRLEAAIQDCYAARAIRGLPDHYREVLRLQVARGYSYAQMAAALDTTVDAVKGRLKRARRQLREELGSRDRCPFCEGLGTFAVDSAGVS